MMGRHLERLGVAFGVVIVECLRSFGERHIL